MKYLVFSLSVILLASAGRNHSHEWNNTPQQEPKCACPQPEFVFDLGGKLKLDYRELNVCTLDDGSLLLQDRNTNKYYIANAGSVSGPYEDGDPKLMGFENCYTESQEQDDWLKRYKGILSKSGDKYLITFKGKTYGPYIEIYGFVVTPSREKFAVLATSGDGEMPKLVTNVPNASFDVAGSFNSAISGSVKFDDIVIITDNGILDLQGKSLFSNTVFFSSERTFINQSNSKYACYRFGTLELSDGKSLPDLFNPHFVKSGNSIYLAYMYYSPAKNAIMQCKIPF